MDGRSQNQGRPDSSELAANFGYKAEQQPIAAHDLHATMLHLLGVNHTKLIYLFNGRNTRLTDVYGELIPQIVG